MLRYKLLALVLWAAPASSLGGWRYSEPGACSLIGGEPIISPTDAEIAEGHLEASSIARAVDIFRACGVVAIDRGCVSDAQGAALRDALRAKLGPLLASRGDLRDALKRAMVERLPLRALGAHAVANVSLLAAGAVYRERDDARIDLTLDAAERSALLPNPFLAAPVLRRLLGAAARLRSAHGVVALAGARAQHWHRDTGLLFADDDDFHLEGVHARDGGVHLPPYALNAFIHLEDLSDEHRGATEFVLGSHQWGMRWAEDEDADDAAPAEERAFRLAAGACVVADYRTIHRGPAVTAGADPRYLAMLVYGRSWWADVINYGRGDYGGFPTPARARDERDARAATLDDEPVDGDGDDAAASAARWRMYWGLVNQWEDGLVDELRADFNQHAGVTAAGEVVS